MGALSVAERNSTSPHYIANGERDIHLFILNARDGHSRLRRRSGKGMEEGSLSSRVRRKFRRRGWRGKGRGWIEVFLLSHFPRATSAPALLSRARISSAANHRGSRDIAEIRGMSLIVARSRAIPSRERGAFIRRSRLVLGNSLFGNL